MDFQSSSDLLFALKIALIFFAIFILSARRCQSIWYIRPIALFAIFYLVFTTLNVFISLFLFRYLRLIVNLLAFCLYRPVAVPDSPKLTAKDVTVIVPTVEPYGDDFEECIHSIQANGPARIVVVSAGQSTYKRAAETLNLHPDLTVVHCEVQNKRKQICKALPKVSTKITVFCDDHVFWPKIFLPSILAPFDDEAVGCVGTRKRVRRHSTASFLSGFWNFLGCLYLERHNFEIAATNTIDGGVFVVSGRTSAHRSRILQDHSFQKAFVSEHTCFGLIGPLNADDDNFITRWMVDHDWKIRIQHSESACVETTLGQYPQFLHQCGRWARTTWRSNPRSLLLSKRVWQRHPWCVYAVHLTSLVNFALLTDPLLVYLFHRQYCIQPLLLPTNNDDDEDDDPLTAAVRPSVMLRLVLLCVWILGSKLVKPWPHFRRHPRDWRYLPGYIVFGYAHSLLKVWALLTVWDVSWGSRALNGDEGDEEGEE